MFRSPQPAARSHQDVAVPADRGLRTAEIMENNEHKTRS